MLNRHFHTLISTAFIKVVLICFKLKLSRVIFHKMRGVVLKIMPISKDKKKVIIEKVADLLKDSKSVVFFNFKGFNVKNTIEMRRKLREAKVGYLVAKKTLAKRAFDGAKIEGVIPNIVGETALAYSTDLIAPAREVYIFQKKYKDNVAIVGGIFDGKYMSKEEMMAIALIPSQETLYAQFVNVINSPIQGWVMALDAIAKKKTV